MSVHYDTCPACDEPLESWAHWDWHRRVDHLRDDEPCEVCGQWDERTQLTEFGWAHIGCAMQVGIDQGHAAAERREAAG